MELVKVRKLDGHIIEYHDGQEKPLIMIRGTQKTYNNQAELEAHKNDFGFIRGLIKTYGKRVQIDNAGLDTEEAVQAVFENPTTKVVFVRNEKGGYDYICFAFLDEENEYANLGYNHAKAIHGLVRSFRIDDFMNKIFTPEYYKKLIKLDILKKIIDEYFETHSDIITINAWLPEFLKERPVKDKTENTDRNSHKKPRAYKNLPAHKILTGAGFKCPYQPIRNYAVKNGRPCDVFVYQLHRKFWQRVSKR